MSNRLLSGLLALVLSVLVADPVIAQSNDGAEAYSVPACDSIRPMPR